MNNQLRNSQPIQIIGTQRSGSNLLRVMLNELDDVVAPHPPHILKTFMPLLNLYEDINQEHNFKEIINDVCLLVETNPVEWENVSLDREAVFKKCTRPSLIQIFRAVYELMAEVNQAKYWCCKSMDNIYYSAHLENEGLKPFYIHLVRDGRDVASSFKKVAVGEKHIYHLALKWKMDQELSSKLVSELGAKRAITIKYEDLIENPEFVMTNICHFLGIDYSVKVMDFFKSSEGLHTAASGYMWQNLTRPIIKGNSKKFRDSLNSAEIDLFEFIAGDELNKYEYELIGTSEPILLSSQTLKDYNRENNRLKKEIISQSHLKIDLEKKKAQEELICEIKLKLSEKAGLVQKSMT